MREQKQPVLTAIGVDAVSNAVLAIGNARLFLEQNNLVSWRWWPCALFVLVGSDARARRLWANWPHACSQDVRALPEFVTVQKEERELNAVSLRCCAALAVDHAVGCSRACLCSPRAQVKFVIRVEQVS